MIKVRVKPIDFSKVIDKEAKAQTERVRNELVEDLKKATPVDTGNARDNWRVVDGKIVNDVDYMENLNAGSSQQAPRFFIEKTLLQHDGVKSNGTVVQYK